MIRCLTVDDEPLALTLMENYIARTPFLELVGSYTDAIKALRVLQTERIDLLFLDIQMPEINGLEVAASIDAFQTKVVFTTAFDSYALEGFRVDAIDYLLKPIKYSDFLRATKKAHRLIENVVDPSGYLLVKADYRLMKIEYNNILYLESLRDYVVIFLETGAEIKTLSTLKGLESTLTTTPLQRVHRSFIVNLSKVKVLERNCIVFGKKLIPISEPFREEVMRKIAMK